MMCVVFALLHVHAFIAWVVVDYHWDNHWLFNQAHLMWWKGFEKLNSCGGRETSCEPICSCESVPHALSQSRSHVHILPEWLIVVFSWVADLMCLPEWFIIIDVFTWVVCNYNIWCVCWKMWYFWWLTCLWVVLMC